MSFMKIYKITTDEKIFYVRALSELDASMKVEEEYFPTVLDDALPDKYDIEEVTEEREAYEESSVDQAVEDGFHSHGGRR